jgi:hypothetical protein
MELGWWTPDERRKQDVEFIFHIWGRSPSEITTLLPALGWFAITKVQGESQVRLYCAELNRESQDIQAYLNAQPYEVKEMFRDLAARLIRSLEGEQASTTWRNQILEQSDHFDGSITITSGKDLSEMSHEELMEGLTGIQFALEKGLPREMKELMRIEPTLFKTPRMATGTVIPIGVKLKMLEIEREESRHDELIGLQKKTLAELEKRSIDAAQANKGGPEKQFVKNTRISVGKYDELCMRWVNRPYIPRQTKSDFLNDNASELDTKTFDRILKDAYKRDVIDKTPGKHGRYKPKIVP